MINPNSAFICHASSDAPEAKSLTTALENRGLKCWIAPRDVRAGANYPEEIVRGIAESEALVVLLSPAANASQHVLRELEIAVSKRKVVIPVRIEEAEQSHAFTYLLASLHWVEASRNRLRSNPEAVVEAILGGQHHAEARMPKRSKAGYIAGAVVLFLFAIVFIFRDPISRALAVKMPSESTTPPDRETSEPALPALSPIVPSATPTPPPSVVSQTEPPKIIPEKAVKNLRFSHPRWGYDCLVPQTWEVGHGGDNASAIPFYHPQNSAAKILMFGSPTNGESLDELLAGRYRGATELSRRTLMVFTYEMRDGQISRSKESFQARVTDYIEGQKRVRCLLIAPPDREMQYGIEMSAPIDSFEQFTKDFEIITDSVRLLKGGDL